MKLKRVVVTGLGALTPIGNTVAEYWQALADGTSGAAPITKFDTTHFRTKFACEVKNFDVNNFIDKKEARKMDVFSQYAIVASEQAIIDAGLDHENFNKNRAGVIWASGIGGIRTFEEEVGGYFKADNQIPRFNPFFIPKMIADISSGLISMRHGWRGPNYITMSACASATNALVDAYNLIRLGKANLFVAGGSEAAITEAGVGGFNALRAMSERNDSPQTASRPFDKDRDGFVLGEGGAALILEELEHAKARGAKIYAELIGGGMSADAYHITAPHPDGLGAQLVMESALEDHNLAVSDIDHINVHGTSTPLGDISEIKAIERVFGEHAYKVSITSTKSMAGHLLGAAGAVEAIAGIFAIQKQLVPPTINHFTADEAFDQRLQIVFNKAKEQKIDTVLSNTFGFGGHNCSIIFRRYNG